MNQDGSNSIPLGGDITDDITYGRTYPKHMASGQDNALKCPDCDSAMIWDYSCTRCSATALEQKKTP